MKTLEQLRHKWNRSWTIGVAGGLMGALFLWQLLGLLVLEPVRTRMQKMQALSAKLQDLQQELSRGERATQYCDAVRSKSVSETPAVVAHRYQQWLLTRTADLGTITVTPAAPTLEGAAGYRISFGVEGDCRLEDLAKLVNEICSTPLLHRISYLNVEPVREGRNRSDEVHFSLTLESLALNGSETIEQIPAPVLAVGGDLQSFLVVHRPFERGYNGPPPPKTISTTNKDGEEVAPVRPRVDPLTSVKLVGSVTVDGRQQAWVVDMRTQGEFTLGAEKVLELPKFSAIILSVDRDFIEIEVGATAVKWDMGTALRDALNRAAIPDDGTDANHF